MVETRTFIVNKMRKIDGKKVGKVGKERSTTYTLEAFDEETGDRLTLKSESSLEAEFDLKDEIVLKSGGKQGRLKGE